MTQSEEVRDLYSLATALSTAVEARFMSPEHGASIWKNFLKNTSIDVPKPVKKEETK